MSAVRGKDTGNNRNHFLRAHAVPRTLVRAAFHFLLQTKVVVMLGRMSLEKESTAKKPFKRLLSTKEGCIAPPLF